MQVRSFLAPLVVVSCMLRSIGDYVATGERTERLFYMGYTN